jgi:hypothetical protein
MPFSNLRWVVANRFGIWRDGMYDLGIAESLADSWNTGRINDALCDEDGISFSVATDNGGIWRASLEADAICVSDAWKDAHFRCLALGPDSSSGTHVYAGGEGLYETDVSAPLPFLTWQKIESLEKQFPNIGTIYRIVVLTSARVIVVACSRGIFHSTIPDPPQRSGCLGSLFGVPTRPLTDSYVWHQAEVEEQGGFHDLALGPVHGGTHDELPGLIGAGLSAGAKDGGFKTFLGGTGPSGLFFGTWSSTGALIMRRAKVTRQGENIDLSDFGLSSVASCDLDRNRAFAVAALKSDAASHDMFGVMRTDDGGKTWEILDAKLQDLQNTQTLLSLRDEAGEPEGVRGQGSYNQSIAVSATDRDIVALGFDRPYLSWDGGRIWTRPSLDRKNNISPHLHSDVHRVKFGSLAHFQNNQLDGVPQSLVAASDGGFASIRWGNGAWIISSDYSVDGDNADLFALVLEGNYLNIYWRPSNNIGQWNLLNAVTDRATGPGCIIQSDFQSGNEGHGNFEVVVLEGSNLVHYWGYKQNGDLVWHTGGVITTGASGPGCIIQSSFRDDEHGNCEVVVPEGNELVHYSKNNADVNNPWGKAAIVSKEAIGGACIFQSDFPYGQDHGNFEVVALEQSGLRHYYRDNGGSPWTWNSTVLITDDAIGPASFIQADYRSDDDAHTNFELVVQERREGKESIWHWIRDNSAPGLPWIRVKEITAAAHKASGPACIIQSTFGSDEVHGNFELVACEGGNIVHYWRDNGANAFPWIPGTIITPCAFSYISRANRTLAALEFNRVSGKRGNSPGYGTLGVCSLVPGLITGGTQDNGVVYGSGVEPRPWQIHISGDGSAAVFLAGRALDGATLVTGNILVDLVDYGKAETPQPASSSIWTAGSFNLTDVIKLGRVNPAEIPPPDPNKGLVLPRVEPVITPRNTGKGAILAIGARGPDLYALVLAGEIGDPPAPGPGTGKKPLPLQWDFLGTIESWHADAEKENREITAIASLDGTSVLVGVNATGQLKGVNFDENNIFQFDTIASKAAVMAQLPAGSKVSLVNSILPITDKLAFAATEGGPGNDGNIIFNDGSGWALTPGEPKSGRVVAIAADPSTEIPTLFVITETKDVKQANLVFVSGDLGRTWLVATNGLPLAIHAADLRWVDDGEGQRLYLSSYGRSVWVANKPAHGWISP